MTKLNVKEERLFRYLMKRGNAGTSPNIGDVCRDCHTTPYILLAKTYPNLKQKLGW